MPDSGISQLFGAAVRRRRIERGMSQEKLAEHAGLHPTYIGLIERGARNPTLASAMAVAKALDEELVDLIAECVPQRRSSGKRKPRR